MTTNVFPTAADTARALIGRILDTLETGSRDVCHIALSGGNTPALMFDLWAAEYAEATPWEKIRFYWVDERCVPPTDKDSNYGMTKLHLLDKVALPEGHAFRIKGEEKPDEECARYAQLVARNVPVEAGLPMFDIVLLGAGDDGHTSSIFPGQEHLLTTDELYAVATHPVSGQRRIALTGKPILEARHVIFLMTGQSKQPVFKAMAGNEDSGPAAYVAHHAKHQVEIYADSLAGA